SGRRSTTSTGSGPDCATASASPGRCCVDTSTCTSTESARRSIRRSRRAPAWTSSQRSAAGRRMDEHVRAYYEGGVELDRLGQGYSRIEFARTKELLDRHLPPAPATVLDVGGGPGVYAEWLAERGYRVHLVDGSPLPV